MKWHHSAGSICIVLMKWCWALFSCTICWSFVYLLLSPIYSNA
jgi:hypothetical protein